MQEEIEDAIRRAAGAIGEADALLIGAGAGMGVDSGLPDFRGSQGFWRAYPPYARLGLDFAAIANPEWFATDPPFAWGFYGHRLNLYRSTRPHDGFAILKRWGEGKPGGAFVVTSNVDGHFQRAGFDPEGVMEVHGSIHWMQCSRLCGAGIFPADPWEVRVDETTFRAGEPLPACPRCGALARPNILMFGDLDCDGARSAVQHDRLNAWLRSVDAGMRLAIVECGAGKAIPTIRRYCEQLAGQTNSKLIRINVRESEVPARHVALPLGARHALHAIDALLGDDQGIPGGGGPPTPTEGG
jgi:NAD-dependent SIR2 family protein deacetylase